jgi:hypothetical protein
MHFQGWVIASPAATHAFLGAGDSVTRTKNGGHFQERVMLLPAPKIVFLGTGELLHSICSNGLSFELPLEKNGISLQIVF